MGYGQPSRWIRRVPSHFKTGDQFLTHSVTEVLSQQKERLPPPSFANWKFLEVKSHTEIRSGLLCVWHTGQQLLVSQESSYTLL